MSIIQSYLAVTPADKINENCLAYLCNLSEVAKTSPQIASFIVKELENQRTHLKLIASENYCSLAVQLAMGNLLTDKYAEGVPGRRFYAGNENVDAIESLAQEEACKLFGAEYANVQPHCGSDANIMAYWAILSTKVEAPMLARFGETNEYRLTDAQWKELKETLGNQRLMALDYFSGGHITHGYKLNMSGRLFDVHPYTVSRETGMLDYDAIEKQAMETRPLILLAGYSAYPRKINFRRMREIADKSGAVLMADMAHFAGLVAGKVFTGDYNPLPWADVVTSTTHKTLRGPRAGMVLARKEYAEALDKGCPMTMGGPLPNVIAAKAVCFKEAQTPEFQVYAQKIVDNSKALAESCRKAGLDILTGGTDNHLFMVNVANLKQGGDAITGRQAESALCECDVTLNRNTLPFDPNGPWYTSGLRIGTAAVTTLGMGETEMAEIGEIIALVLKATHPLADGKNSRSHYSIEPAAKAEALRRAKAITDAYPVYPGLDLALLKKEFA
jgi:glycine hydroxymethyltransferase